MSGYTDNAPSFGTLNLTLTHRHFDVFDLESTELSEDVHILPLTFLTAPEGDVMALTVPFESLLEAIRFECQPDPRTQDPKLLQGLTGTYVMGPIEIIVGLRLLACALARGADVDASHAGKPGIRAGSKPRIALRPQAPADSDFGVRP